MLLQIVLYYTQIQYLNEQFTHFKISLRLSWFYSTENGSRRSVIDWNTAIMELILFLVVVLRKVFQICYTSNHLSDAEAVVWYSIYTVFPLLGTASPQLPMPRRNKVLGWDIWRAPHCPPRWPYCAPHRTCWHEQPGHGPLALLQAHQGQPHIIEEVQGGAPLECGPLTTNHPHSPLFGEQCSQVRAGQADGNCVLIQNSSTAK